MLDLGPVLHLELHHHGNLKPVFQWMPPALVRAAWDPLPTSHISPCSTKEAVPGLRCVWEVGPKLAGCLQWEQPPRAVLQTPAGLTALPVVRGEPGTPRRGVAA